MLEGCKVFSYFNMVRADDIFHSGFIDLSINISTLQHSNFTTILLTLNINARQVKRHAEWRLSV